MPYFRDNYPLVRHPIADGSTPGLRNAQIGGLYAIASHLTRSKEPALAVMPTGTGKTAVLMLTPYLRRSARALIVTPSILVRGQVADDFKNLAVLRRMEVLPSDAAAPRVFEQRSRAKTLADWAEMANYDVIVATPNGISPDYSAVPKPPPDLFDVLLIDEAHHSPAKTWKAILDCFPAAEKVLFTATPYRLDGMEIKARQVYSYPLRAAFDDGVFGRVRYCPVTPAAGQSNDAAIAGAAEAIYRADRAAGLRHKLMVRTSQIKRAKELAGLYAASTGLRLELVTSHHSVRHMRRAVERLKADQLDGVVCVDMMSEGFDFPWLKIAALHAPHKSLAMTLQFIGRFARTNAPDIGEAKFIAVPGEVAGEVQQLYDENAVWEEVIVDLHQKRAAEEAVVRDGVESFAPPLIADPELTDLSLFSLSPYSHVKVYRVACDDIDIGAAVRLPPPFRIVYHRVSEELSAAVVVTNERQQPRWTGLPVFTRSEYDLFVVYYDRPTKLLFINASRRSQAVYEEIATHYSRGTHKILPRYAVDRVRQGLQNAEFFNVGMKNRVTHSTVESYRIISGKRADRAVTRSDGRTYHRGHLFGKGTVDGRAVTLGYSSASKIWSNRNLQIPHLVAWCRGLAARLASDRPAPTHPGLDFLPIGEAIKEIPDGVLLVQWPSEVFAHHTDIAYVAGSGEVRRVPVTETELVIDRRETGADRVSFAVAHEGFTYGVVFRLDGDQFFGPADPLPPEPVVFLKGDEVGLLTFLNNYPATLLCADYSSVAGDEQIRYAALKLDPFDPACVEAVDWAGAGVDITLEFAAQGKASPARSIHDFLWARLDSDEYAVVVYDHRVGEAADFVAFSRDGGRVLVSLFHCKGSGGPKPGDRADDLYEVCGQAIKGLGFVEKEPLLLRHLTRRTDSGSRFVRGDPAALKAEFDHGRTAGFLYRVCLVQPGITRAGLTPKSGEMLAATADYLTKSGVRDVIVMGSA